VRDGKLTVEETEQQEYEGNRHVPDAQVVLGALAQEAGPGQPVFWTGDFNVPSHLDWTQAAADAGLNGGYIVEWPVSKMLQEAGFGDAWRDFHPDPVAHRGLTWTPSQPLDHPEEVHDRIDFVYYRGDVDLVEAEVIGEAEAMADRVVADYPSDHRAVLGTFRLAERDDLSADGAKNALDGQPVTNGALRRR
jgi:exonuclease III